MVAANNGVQQLKPFVHHCLHRVARECQCLVLGDQEVDAAIWFADVVELLRRIGKRWQVASESLH